jgi:hypothetical protein
MLADTGLGFKKEEANHNLDNNQRPDVMAANIVDGKSDVTDGDRCVCS